MNPLPILLLVLMPVGAIQVQVPSDFIAPPSARDKAVPVQLAALETAAPKERNLLENGDFEHGTDGWELIAFGKKGEMAIDTKELRNGRPTLRIDNVEGDHSFVRQTVKGKPGTRYRLAGYIKTMNVKPVKGSGKEGAVLMVGMVPDTTQPLQRTTPWKRVSVDFTPKNPDEIRVGPSLGTYARPVTGTAWFSDITLMEVGGGEKR